MAIRDKTMYSFAIDRASFGRVSSDDAAVIGEAYWGNVPEGTTFNPHQFSVIMKSTQEKFKKDAPGVMVPLQGRVFDEIYYDYIFNCQPRNMTTESFNDYAAKAKETLDKNAEKYIDEIIKKADSTTSPIGAALMHVITDDQVTYLYKRPYPFQTLIPVGANKGKTASWDSIGPYEIGSADFGSEDPNLTETDIIAHTRTDTIKYMYAVGRLTKAVKLAGLAQVPVRDIKAIRIDVAQDAMRALRERSMMGVNRDVTSITNEFVAAAPNQYKGAYELITANTSGAPTTGDQCWIDVSGSSVDSFDEIMLYLDKTYRNMVLYGMQPNLAICDYATFGLIRRGLTTYFRFTGEGQELIPGVSKLTLTFPNIGGISLVPHPFLRMDTGTNGSIFLIDTRMFERRVLWADTYEELANINTSDKFVISAAETLIERSDVDGTSSLQGGLFGVGI